MIYGLRWALPIILQLAAVGTASAVSFAFPDPRGTVDSMQSPLAWLTGSNGDDGYVTVKAEVVLPGVSCVGLGKEGWASIGRERMQLVVSIRTSGFKSELDGQELPIAIFDGRSTPGGCAVLNTLPLTIIPFARLEPFADLKAEALTLLLNVNSSTESDVDIVGASQTLLGAAAVFATGGAAATVSGLTATLSKPTLAAVQEKYNAANTKVVPGQARRKLSWGDVRGGIQRITVPVFMAETSHGESVADAIAKVQAIPNDGRDVKKIFDVVLTFSYVKTVFDPRAVGKDDLPKRDTIAPASVMNHPQQPSVPNLLQLLNGKSPSLQETIRAANGNALSTACGTALSALEGAGLALIDRTVVVKTFIDEAKGSPAWYEVPANFNACFRDYPDIAAMAIRIYGNAATVFSIGDIQDGTGEKFNLWKTNVAPILEQFRTAMLVKEGRKSVLQSLNGGADIPVEFRGDPATWPNPGAIPPAGVAGNTTQDSTPGITRLAAKTILNGGCFAYGEASNLELTSPGGYLLLSTSDPEVWAVHLVLATGGTGKIAKAVVFLITKDWKDYFKSNTYPGGECASILKLLG